MRERGSQTDEEGVDEELNHGCSMCSKKLDGIQEKLDKVLALIPEMQKLQAKVTKLEKEKMINLLCTFRRDHHPI